MEEQRSFAAAPLDISNAAEPGLDGLARAMERVGVR
jgi:hypothetical protein